MVGLHLFSCRGVRSEQFVKGKNSLGSRHVCVWSSASTMTLWNASGGMKSQDVLPESLSVEEKRREM